MKSAEDSGQGSPVQSRTYHDDLVFMTQLLQSTRTMFHIDDLFLWLEQQFVQRLQMQVAQCWAVQSDTQDQLSLELRSYVYKDPSLPVRIVTNDQVVLLATRLATEHNRAFFQPVDALFSSYQTILLKRYGLYYCSGYSVQQSTLLPPPNSEEAAGRLPVPLRLVLVFFMRHASSQKLLPLITAIFERALLIAKDRNLLLSPYQGLPIPRTPSLPFTPVPSLSTLIPRRIENIDHLRSSNPFSRSLIISDSQVRSLYKYIDGLLDVRHLALSLLVPEEKVLSLLRPLLDQGRVQLYEPSGKLINSDLLFKKS